MSQRGRLVAAAAYLSLILLVGAWALRWAWRPLGIRGLWFYSAAATLVLGEFILEPFFTRPADALANGSALLLTAVARRGTRSFTAAHRRALLRSRCASMTRRHLTTEYGINASTKFPDASLPPKPTKQSRMATTCPLTRMTKSRFRS
jgi:hypothetical protein